MKTLLFFDDLGLTRRENMVRHIGRPRLVSESVFCDPYVNTTWGYPGVYVDEARGRWRLIYQGKLSEAVSCAVVAESEDGLHWMPRDTTAALTLADRVVPHQLLPMEGFGEWSNCFLDPLAPPAERIKGLVVYRTGPHAHGSRLLTSPDGLRWRIKQGVEWQSEGPDPLTSVFWNEIRGSYVLTTRPLWTDRRIALSETRDWVHFSKPELALEADALDAPLTEPYGMPVIPYEGYFVGLLWLYHCPPGVDVEARPGPVKPHKFLDGHVDCQLAYSLNGWHFQRCLRDAFIPNVYPCTAVRREDGSLWIYASASIHEHGRLSKGSGSIVTYLLRRDGFVYLESGGGVGIVGTRALYWKGGEVELNVQSPGGTARAQVTDPAGAPLAGYEFAQCEPFSGDSTAWVPRWKGGKLLAAHRGRAIRIEVELNNARLYALRGDMVRLVAAEVALLHEEGVLPEPRPGF